MSAFAFYLIPEAGEPSMRLVEASNDAAAAQAIHLIQHERLRAVWMWDGHRSRQVRPPARVAIARKPVVADIRGAQMIKMKTEGKTRREISIAFDMSADRVAQIMKRTQYRAGMQAKQPNRTALSARAQTILSFLIAQPESDPAERDQRLPERVAALNRARILCAESAGKQTLAEIEAWLWERGLSLSDEE